MKQPACPVEQRVRVRSALGALARQYRTQAELGRALHVRQQTVSAVLAGTSNPGLFLAIQIARAVHVPLEVLLDQGWTGAPEIAA
jgi:DNA-binding XRE family transcriptional regulator